MLLPSHPPLTIDPGSRTGRSVAPALPAPWSWQRAEDGLHINSGKMPMARPPRRNCRARARPGRSRVRALRPRVPTQPPGSVRRPRRVAGLARRAEGTRRRQAQEAAEREARRPVCGDCGSEFTDGRWKAGTKADWGPRGQAPAPVRRLRDAGVRTGAEGGTGRSRAPGGQRRRSPRRPTAGADAARLPRADPPRRRAGLPRRLWASPRCRGWRLQGWTT